MDDGKLPGVSANWGWDTEERAWSGKWGGKATQLPRA